MTIVNERFKRSFVLKQHPIPLCLEGLIVGTVLGDGSLMYQRNIDNRNGVWLSINHSAKQRRYVDFKRRLFDRFCVCAASPKYQKANNSYSFTTICHPDLTALRNLIYGEENRKRITPEILSLVTIPGFVLWFFDDGSCGVCTSRGSWGYNLATHCYTLEEVKLVRMWLFKRLGIKTTPIRDCHENKVYYRLYFARDTVPVLERYLCDFMVEGMGYKLRPQLRSSETTRQAPLWDDFIERMKI